MYTRALAAGLLVLVVAGCGGSESANSATQAKPEPTSWFDKQGVKDDAHSREATVTTEVDYATVSQYASIVAESERDLSETMTELDEECLWSAPGHVSNDPALIVCDLGPMTAELQASTLRVKLKSASKESASAYIGQVPVEIEDLVADTIDTTKALTKAGRKLSKTECVSEGGRGCLGKLVDFDWAMDDMSDQLAAWSPYL